MGKIDKIKQLPDDKLRLLITVAQSKHEVNMLEAAVVQYGDRLSKDIRYKSNYKLNNI